MWETRECYYRGPEGPGQDEWEKGRGGSRGHRVGRGGEGLEPKGGGHGQGGAYSD